MLKGPPQLDPSTECVHVVPVINDPYDSCSVPIYQTATFKHGSSYDYTRSGNPTRSQLEAHLAKLMKATTTLVTTSGMSALDVILRLVKSGNEIIAGTDIYGGTNRLLSFVSSQNNIKVHNVDTCNVNNIRDVLNSKTRLILLETPTNPMMRICDIKQICELAHVYDCLVCVDNTMMSPYLQQPLTLGADIVYHSGTKYLSGHHDLMAGAIGVADETLGKVSPLTQELYFIVNAIGCGLAPFECFLLFRGVKTLAVRLERQQETAQKLAEFLSARFKTHYPGLASHPDHKLHLQQSRGPGAVLSFETASVEESERIIARCKLWTVSVSFVCVNSIISMPCKMSHASIPQEIRRERQLPENLIRLCVGIEHYSDLLADLEQAITN
jgi:cystathionine beta-lyase